MATSAYEEIDSSGVNGRRLCGTSVDLFKGQESGVSLLKIKCPLPCEERCTSRLRPLRALEELDVQSLRAHTVYISVNI